MMRIKQYMMTGLITGIVALSMITFVGCGSSSDDLLSASEVETLLSQAQTKLANGDIESAIDDYQTILNSDSTNIEANFVVSITNLGGVLSDDSASSLASALSTLDGSTITIPSSLDSIYDSIDTASVANLVIAATNTELTTAFASVQNIVDTTFIPLIDEAIIHITRITDQTNPTLTLDADLLGSEQDITLKAADFRVISGLLHLLDAILNQGVAYNFEVEQNDVYKPTTLKSDGSTHMGSAATHITSALDEYKLVLDSLIADASGSTIFNNVSNSDLQQALDIVTGLRASIDGTDGTDTNIVYDSSTTIKTNLGAFYKSPIADLRDYSDSSVSGYDYTISGLFPDFNTESDLTSLYGL